ncbi:TBC1 domain family member 17-like [Gossypium australe]|uniref:TBC1 domain family member 17-like n=1 Tax=Gossypium australe TaxID=47621 RepID=A0A5B6W6N8_9ROSI|nr:TBC1 domain family member 17-like [Gossypium australe]
MQEAELHDLSDDADYAASQQQGSASIMRCDSGKKSSSSEPEGAQIVYLKDNVTIHPTQFASERISGRLKLIKQGSSLFMTWIPYKGQSTNARLSEKDRNLYTIRAVPFADVRSIRRHTPALGWQFIIVVLSFGLAFPPLYFYNGGVRGFLATVKQHVLLVRSAEDANVFLVNDFQNPLQRTLSSLELPRAVSIASVPSTPVSVGESSSQQNEERTDVSASIPQYNGRQRQKGHDPARDISIQVLEKFSLVTKFARETTSQLFRETHSNGFGPLERRNSNQSALDYSHKSSEYKEDVPVQSPVDPDPLEFDKLSLVWGKPRQPPLGLEEWATFLDSEGRVVDPKALRKRIFYGGVEHKFRKEVWAILLGYHSYESTYAEREYQKSIKKTEYETIKNQWQVLSVVMLFSLLKSIFQMLAKLFHSISPGQAKRFTKFRERKGLIEKDVVRTDRSLSFYDGDDNPNVNLLRDILLTYSFYNFDLGYCQGMSDLLSPILFVMEDESESFWCFVALMERLGPNFNHRPLHKYFEQNDCLNYFFCFRWILIQFKRELEYEQTMRLWEVLWTHYLSEHLHLYVCVAILKRYRGKIMGEQMDFDTLLKFINELSGQIELDAILRDAEALCICAGENGAACIPPGTPPSLPVDNGLFYSQQDDEVL